MTAIVWFRRDLRLADNPALAAALATGQPVLPLYIHAPDDEAPWQPGAASNWWLDRSLRALDVSLRAIGSSLVVRAGDPAAVLRELLQDAPATRVFANRVYDPAARARDERLARELDLTLVPGASLWAEPEAFANKTGQPYRVFTPFWRALRAQLSPDAPLAAPQRLRGAPASRSPAIDALALRPAIAWDGGLADAWQPGEAGAQDRLRAFLDDALASYAAERDRPDRDGTSRLSPHLHFGEISPRQILWALQSQPTSAASEKFLAELGWREFSHHLLFHFPDSTTQPLDARFARFPWSRTRGHLAAWRRGRTGVPLVDAGMRQLWHTGWMHNRVRMVVASFLTKNLRRHWLDGARWFWDTLVDADLANNTQGWQWTAGCGADAAPYFRVFNPVTQGERFDPTGAYVKRWLPELAKVPASQVHAPWTLRPIESAAYGLSGTVYERPIVDLAQSREQALAAYASIRSP
jgi:deoxyribodipyrimidine photo-lyase